MASQSHQPTFYLLKHRLPASESAQLLGRVINHYQDPTFDYTPESPSVSLTPEVFNNYLLGSQQDDGAHFLAQSARDEKLWSRMMGLWSLSTTSTTGGMTEVISTRITTRRLKRESDYFKAIKSIPEVRRKVLEMCPVGRKVYLVVGTMSIHKGVFRRTGTQRTGRSISGSIPLGIVASAAVAAAGLPLPPNVIPDPEAGTERSNTSEWAMESTITATGKGGEPDASAEEVFAIACKEISRDWHGLGSNIKMKPKRTEYRGGQYFGNENELRSEDESEDESIEIIAAEELCLADKLLEGQGLDFIDFSPSTSDPTRSP